MASPEIKPPDNRELLETLLTMPGAELGAYSRFHRYSSRNLAWFFMQGIEPQPVATYAKWQEVGRHVTKGSRAKYVLRPITIKERDDAGEETGKAFTRFKAVKAIFALCDTEGEALPTLETPKWSLTRALGKLAIEQVPFESFDANTAGYSTGRQIAISDVSPNRLKTAMHEASHVLHGHTTPDFLEEYALHRGNAEFEAEASAYLTMSAIDALDERTATISRNYCQTWLRGERPSEQSIGRVLKVHDELLAAGLDEGVDK